MQRSSKVMGGTPVFAGTRVPIQTLLDYLESGDRLDDFLDEFPTVTREMAGLDPAKSLRRDNFRMLSLESAAKRSRSTLKSPSIACFRFDGPEACDVDAGKLKVKRLAEA